MVKGKNVIHVFGLFSQIVNFFCLNNAYGFYFFQALQMSKNKPLFFSHFAKIIISKSYFTNVKKTAIIAMHCIGSFKTKVFGAGIMSVTETAATSAS